MQKPDNSTPHQAKDYDSNIYNTIPYYALFHEETIKLIKSMGIKPKTWLDTGCGTGTLVEKALNHFPDTQFLLADPSCGMLDESKEKLAKYESRVIFLEPAASHKISIPCTVDVVTAIQSHHYMSKEERFEATKTVYNLLNENGVFITFENISPLTEKGIEIGKKYWKNFQISKGKNEEEVENHLKRFNVEYLPLNIEEHLSLLRKCGFSVVEMFWYSYMQAGFYCIK
ncbi:class I SAM-dependent methyltransferase [Methanobacterium sp.]|uniref:class I SAM-dependent methyltransferase n=1 Tax=Methanobacterium sp. TaxID=2164 RepID=UPI003D65FFDE